MICVAWMGMGSYVQCSVKQLIKDTDEEVRIIAIASDVPKICESEIAGAKVIWVEQNDQRTIDQVLGEMPRVLVISGWYLPILRRYFKGVKKSGGIVIGTLDNPMLCGIKLILWAIYFNIKYRRYFDGFITAGESTRRLLRTAGYSNKRISVGNYPCDLSLFTDGGPLSKREKKIVYVGRFIPVKNILTFVKAFARFSIECPGWNLDLYGQGEQLREIEETVSARNCENIVMHPFATPQYLADMYKKVRALVLPSWSDHWGVVVQEATASGCAVLASTGVRAADAFCNEKNSFLFDPTSEDEMYASLIALAKWSDTQWDEAQKESVRLAQKLTPKVFSNGVLRLIDLNKRK